MRTVFRSGLGNGRAMRAALLVTAVTLLGCGRSPAPSAAFGTSGVARPGVPDGNGGGNSSTPGISPGPQQAIPKADACATRPAGAALTPPQQARMVALRQKFFGPANVDAVTGVVRRDRVIASWVDVTGFALALDGHVLLLDAYIGNLPADSGYSPTDDCELSDLRPEMLFVGHGHYDHAQLVAAIANRNRDLQVVGTGELCTDLGLAAAGTFTPHCLSALPLGAALGTRAELSPLLAGIAITAIKHPHSAASAPNNGIDSLITPVPAYPKSVPTSPCSVGGAPNNQDGSCPLPATANFIKMSYTQALDASVLFQFRFGEFVLTWNNTNGPNVVGDAELTAMAGLPQTDVELGSIFGFNAITNGLTDARHIAEALRTRLLVPGHHDFVGPYQARTYQPALTSELAKTPAATRPGVAFITDTTDYIKPARLTFDPSAAIWQGAGPLEEDAAVVQ